MFPAEKPGQWEPNKIRKRKRTNVAVTQPNGANANGNEAAEDVTKSVEAGEDDSQLEEDPESDEGALWPIQQGRITEWSCFFALMEQCFKNLGGSFHMPIMLISQPAWTAADRIRITRFFFETFKCPAFALMDSAQAVCYAYGIPTACVIDIGKDKADVTAVTEFLTHDQGRAIAVADCGGEAMTQHLLEQLKADGFSRDMCEQLKMSNICEIPGPDVPIPGASTSKQPKAFANGASNPTAAASAGGNDVRPNDDSQPRRMPENGNLSEQAIPNQDEGVIDVASIVTGGNMNEYLEKKEQEKAEKQTSRKKGGNAPADPPKPARLKNSEKETNNFVFRDRASRDAAKDSEANGLGGGTNGANNPHQAANGSGSATTSPVDVVSPNLTSPTATSFPRPSSSSKDLHSRPLTVGPARFRPLPPHFLPLLTSAIHRVIESVPSPSQRPALWDSLLITGAASHLRGFKEALVDALSARYIISPSSATMFTSEIPSNFSTPAGTGANTPQPQAQPSVHQGFTGGQLNMGGNRSLLQAATTASASQFNRPGQFPGQQPLPPLPPYAAPSTPGQNSQYLSTPGQVATPSFRPPPGSSLSGLHSQTPASIKTGKLPEYFAEWREAGSESQAAFLGAQVAAKVFFMNDVHVSLTFIDFRTNYPY